MSIDKRQFERKDIKLKVVYRSITISWMITPPTLVLAVVFYRLNNHFQWVRLLN